MESEVLLNALKDAVSKSHSPGAVACVGNREGILSLECAGNRQVKPEVHAADINTLYDLASLTKVVATTTALMLLRNQGFLDLDEPIAELLPIPAFKFTVRHCMTHSAGLIAGCAYYENASGLIEMLQRYSGLELSWPAGTRRRYSDVSYMILGKVVELITRDSLDHFCAKNIFAKLGMNETGFKPPAELRARAAATENCTWRGGYVVGYVHDENCYAAGGVTGHAGLFSTAGDLAKFCAAMLNYKILPKDTLEEMMRPAQVPVYPWQGLGWKVNPWACGSEGYVASRRAIGHTGWTGTSIWMDFDSGIYSILLSNTCHPSRETRDSKTLRQVYHNAVAAKYYPNTANVHTGLDRVVWDLFDAIKGKKLALLTHHAAVDELGRNVLDVLALDSEVDPRVVYTPEHGLKGDVEAGFSIEGERAGKVKVISLYGKQTAPSQAELKDIDLFLIDMQDVGARWYTYMATMLDALRVCAKAGVPVMVLDRPNPIGGDIIEGPIATECNSLVCCAPIPARHGMTMGELATFFAGRMPELKNLKLSVSTMDGWKPSLPFKKCQLPWIPPSPNIPTPETALLYSGMCLFEATNMNEGRGTDTPFALLGAPWLMPDKVIAALPADACHGVSCSPCEYTPRSIPGKSADPRCRDVPCHGIHVVIDDEKAARPFTFSVALIAAIRKVHPNEFVFENKGFDRLAGGPSLRAALEKGTPAAEIMAGYAPELKKFDAMRPKLYSGGQA
jgi:uncharacterized protein YbbC (DUF1343 family)/CubicO group peptidase (beta-lactamase class C family)